MVVMLESFSYAQGLLVIQRRGLIIVNMNYRLSLPAMTHTRDTAFHYPL